MSSALVPQSPSLKLFLLHYFGWSLWAITLNRYWLLKADIIWAGALLIHSWVSPCAAIGSDLVVHSWKFMTCRFLSGERRRWGPPWLVWYILSILMVVGASRYECMSPALEPGPRFWLACTKPSTVWCHLTCWSALPQCKLPDPPVHYSWDSSG